MFKIMFALSVVDPRVINWEKSFQKHFCDYIVTSKQENSPGLKLINSNPELTLIYRERLLLTKTASGHRGFFEAVKRGLEI